MKKKISKVFSRIKQFLIKYKKQSIILGILVVICTTIFGYFSYKKYENTKPIGISQTVNTSDGEKQVSATEKEPLLSDEKGFDLLKEKVLPFKFLDNVTPVKEKDRKEFEDTSALRKNILLLSDSGKPSDFNQIAAIWMRNIKNYNFTYPQNLIVAGMAEDFMIYENYLEKINGVKDENSRADFEEALATRINNEFKTPMSLGIIGSTLSEKGINKVVYDENSIVPRLVNGQHYINATQYKDLDDAATSTTLAYVNSEYKNVLTEIFRKYKEYPINSIYEVKINSKNDKIKTVSYIIEDPQGKLHYYGIYLTEPNAVIKTVKEFREELKNNKGQERTGKHNDSITWKNFTDYVEGKE